jgi:hypothetical protein
MKPKSKRYLPLAEGILGRSDRREPGPGGVVGVLDDLVDGLFYSAPGNLPERVTARPSWKEGGFGQQSIPRSKAVGS